MEERLCQWLTRFTQVLAAIALSMAVGVAVGRLSQDPPPAAPPIPEAAQALMLKAQGLASVCPSLRQSAVEFSRHSLACTRYGAACLELPTVRLHADLQRCEQSLRQATLQRQRRMVPEMHTP